MNYNNVLDRILNPEKITFESISVRGVRTRGIWVHELTENTLVTPVYRIRLILAVFALFIEHEKSRVLSRINLERGARCSQFPSGDQVLFMQLDHVRHHVCCCTEKHKLLRWYFSFLFYFTEFLPCSFSTSVAKNSRTTWFLHSTLRNERRKFLAPFLWIIFFFCRVLDLSGHAGMRLLCVRIWKDRVKGVVRKSYCL